MDRVSVGCIFLGQLEVLDAGDYLLVRQPTYLQYTRTLLPSKEPHTKVIIGCLMTRLSSVASQDSLKSELAEPMNHRHLFLHVKYM